MSSCPAASGTTSRLERALATGCARVNIGTAALEQPEWCEEIIASYGDRIAIGLDVRGTRLAARGWTREGGDAVRDAAPAGRAGCARFVVTDVSSDGMLAGPNLELLRQVCDATDKPVVASGGISTLEDICALAEHGRSSESKVRSLAPRSTWEASPSRRPSSAAQLPSSDHQRSKHA